MAGSDDAFGRLIHDDLNTGPSPLDTARNFITPVEQFFTRSHAAVPRIDPATWRLQVDGLVEHPRSFSLADLDRFPCREVAATLVCAGLRRAEFLATGPLPGELPWGPEPVSTARWSGISLAGLLQSVGIRPEARHVEFTGLDSIERLGDRFGFGGSIELAKALEGDTLLATALNGVPLPPSHGFPLRAIVPGWIGARSVKWLGKLTLVERESGNYFQSRAYRVQREPDPQKPRDVTAGVPLRDVPVNSVILDPAPGQQLAAGPVRVRGWAMGGSARPLAAVEFSSDDGASWVPATIAVPGDGWTWTFWEAEVDLLPGPHILVVRATDQAGTTQPIHPGDTWNVKGYANNAWHRVSVLAR